MYLVHGGTNFGLTAGFGMTTSYDYAAPINEQGSMTEKYNVFRSLMTSYSKETLVAPPASIETMNVTLGKTVALSSIFDNFPEGD
jgi:beta-galactosidase